MTNIRIILVEQDPRTGHWRIGQKVDDGTGPPLRHLHLIPSRAFVEHAAEYGLDPADSRTILDWLLHERFVVHPDPHDMGPFCPYRNPPGAAWAAHRRSLAEVKSRVSITDPDGLLERIHRAHDPHPVHIIEAMERVAQTRAHVAHHDRRRRTGG